MCTAGGSSRCWGGQPNNRNRGCSKYYDWRIGTYNDMDVVKHQGIKAVRTHWVARSEMRRLPQLSGDILQSARTKLDDFEIMEYNRRLTVRSISKAPFCWEVSLDPWNHHCQAHGSESQESSQYDGVDQLRHYRSIDEHKVHITGLALNITAMDNNAS